jgi:hypothetical protein
MPMMQRYMVSPVVRVKPGGGNGGATWGFAGRSAKPAAPSIRVMPTAPPQSSFSPKNEQPRTTAMTGEMKA